MAKFDTANPLSPAKRDDALDGLRGLAALAVLCNHVGLATVGAICAPRWLLWPADGTAAVMIFFVLSGYVIGLTNPPSAETKDVRLYVRRRLLRLMPINVVAVCLAWLVASHVDLWTTLANLLFLGNYSSYAGIVIPVIASNENLWSLNYEVLYYGLFILVWLFQPPLKYVFGVSLVVTVLGWYTSVIPLFVACYAAGFLFWISGLALAWHAPPSDEERTNWPSCVLLLLVTWKLRGLLNVLSVFPMPLFDGPVVRLYYLDFLPVCLWLLAIVARRRLQHLAWIKGACVCIPLVGLVIKWNHPGYFTPLDYRMALGACLLALLLWQWRPSLRFFRCFAPAGAIAFALYAVSRPIQTFVFSHGQWLPQNYLGFAVCASVTLALCIGAAWYLERRLQPWLNRLFKSGTSPRK